MNYNVSLIVLNEDCLLLISLYQMHFIRMCIAILAEHSAMKKLKIQNVL